MGETKKGFIQLHLSVLLAGFTGLFGRLITLNEVDIVWFRMLFTSIILLVFTGLPRVGWRKFMQLCGCGALLGFHWILFYGSIKLSNVSIGVICFSLIGFFTAIFEPLIFKKRFSAWELLFSLITVVGVLCIFSFDARYRHGIMVGVVSSAVCALYAICNKKARRKESYGPYVPDVRWSDGCIVHHSHLSLILPLVAARDGHHSELFPSTYSLSRRF